MQTKLAGSGVRDAILQAPTVYLTAFEREDARGARTASEPE